MKTLLLTPIFIFVISLHSVQSSSSSDVPATPRTRRQNMQPRARPLVVGSLRRTERHNVGDIVMYQNTLHILRETDERVRWFGILNENEDVIFDRIWHRHPTSPAAYHIPPVRYRRGDRVMDGQRQIGKEGNGHMWEITTLQMGAHFDLMLMDGNVLERLDWVPTQHNQDTISDLTHVPYAKRWRDMWVVQELLPQNEEERALADRLDQELEARYNRHQ